MDGQIDAMKGQWKVKYTTDSCVVWIASPWPDKRNPTYKKSICK